VQHILIAVPGGFEGGGGLGRFLAAGRQRIQRLGQRLGPGAACVEANVPLGRAETLEAERMMAQQVAGGTVGIVFQRVGGVAADDAPQDGVGMLGVSSRLMGPTLSRRATKALLAAA